MNRFGLALLGVLMVSGYLLASTMDHDDAAAAERHYAEMVCAGHWPDYRGLRPNCTEIKP